MLVPINIIGGYYEFKGSKFISFLIPINSFKDFVVKSRYEHPKAVHFVTASRSFNKEGQIEESFSDDGEPKGTSGMPMLKVIRGYELIECGVLSIRYFGGTLLGTGGLVKAYTQSAKEPILNGIKENLLKEYVKHEIFEFFIPFAKVKHFEYLTSKIEATIIDRNFIEKGVIVSIAGQKEVLDSLKAAI